MKPELDGRKDIKICEKACARTGQGTVRHAKSDHVIVTYRGSVQVIVDRQMGYGLACKIWKWMSETGILKAAGVIATFVAAALGILALAI